MTPQVALVWQCDDGTLDLDWSAMAPADLIVLAAWLTETARRQAFGD